MIYDGVMLHPIDYTNKFRNAMRNWRIPEFEKKFESEALEQIKLAEDLIKDKLRSLNKVWAICVECDKHKDDDFESYKTYLHLRAGSVNMHEPFHSLTNMLKFSEWIYIDYNDTSINEDYTAIVFTFPLENPIAKRKNWIGVQLRMVESRPLQLKEMFEKKYNKEFW